MNFSATTIQCLAATNVEEESLLWNYRFSHLNFKSMNQLSNKQMVCGMSPIYSPSKTCEGFGIYKNNHGRDLKSVCITYHSNHLK